MKPLQNELEQGLQDPNPVDQAPTKIDRGGFFHIAAGNGQVSHFESEIGGLDEKLRVKNKIVRVLMIGNRFQDPS